MQRRQFVQGAASLLVLGPVLGELAGCGDKASGAGDGSAAGTGAGATGAGTGAGTSAGTSAQTAGTSGGTGNTSGSGAVAGNGNTSGHDGETIADAAVSDDAAIDAAIDAGTGAGDVDAAPACADGAHDTLVTDQHSSPHHILLTMSEVLAATEGDYSIKGSALHDHTIHLTPAQFATLASGGSVTVTSTTDMGLDLHNHDVTLECA